VAALVVATFFGAGLSPKAPGTVGSAASLILWGPMVMWQTPWWARLIVAVVLFAAGTWAANAIVAHEGKQDPQKVVMDEVVGMGITLCLAPPTWIALVTGFVLFRIFDIAKPWPVSWADKHVKDGFGTMLDDAFAGAYALAAFLLVERYVFPLLPKELLA